MSQDVKNDIKMQSAFLGIYGYIVPGSEAPSMQSLSYIAQFSGAMGARDSSRLQFDFDEGFNSVAKNVVNISEIASEDLGILEKLADTFDAQVEQVRSAATGLTPMDVERNSKTGKYFLEFEKIEQKYNALVSSLDDYSSANFRTRIKKLRAANDLFGDIANYTYKLIEGRSFGYPLAVSGIFPEFADEEVRVRNCVLGVGADCAPNGPFPGGYQGILQKLSDEYRGLLND